MGSTLGRYPYSNPFSNAEHCSVEGYLAHKNPPPPGLYLCLGPYGGPRGWAISHERGTPVLDERGAPHCRANMAHTRQPRPDSGLGFQVKVVQTSPVCAISAVERTWHTQDSQGQVLALAFRQKSLKPFRRQSRPNSGRGFHVEVLETFQVVPSATCTPPSSEYRGTLRTRNSTPPGPHSRILSKALWWP